MGYGDVYPITAGGRLFTGLILLVGLGIVAVPAGILASALSEARRAAMGEPVSPDAANSIEPVAFPVHT